MSNDGKSTTPRVQSPEARKKTQKFIGWASLAAVMGVAVISAIFFENSPPTTLAPQQSQMPAAQTSIAAPGNNVKAQDVWVGKSEAQLNSLTESQKQLFAMMERLEKNQQIQPATQQIVTVEPKPLINLDKQPVTAPPPPTAQTLPPPPPEEVKDGLPSQSGQMRAPHGIASGVMEGASAPQATSDPKAAADKPSKDGNDVTNYIPAGSFAKVTMLSGMDAPTGGQAQTNPQPVLFRVDGNAIMPNKFKFQVKECHVVGSGFGDIAAERAYVRAESMSCILDGGETIDVTIKGYVSGEDGKNGLRGRLVTKQGQLLANALIAGIGAGIGQAFQQNAMTSSVSALGSTQSVQPGKQFEAGISSGVGKALDRLANYYIQLAEKTFPVIEVDAGRSADLILTQGVSFNTAKPHDKQVTLGDVAEEGRSVGRGQFSHSRYYD